uniref:Uncharacterized protein MANES_02G121800 n=1 Tax=Rhizophora mucronata TaxID=61149 RepID=A0A2P2KZ40_RHIMU
MASMIEFLRPITHAKFRSISYSNSHYSQQSCFCRRESRVLPAGTHRYLSNSLTFSSYNGLCHRYYALSAGALWRFKMREYRILAKCQEGDSPASTGETRGESDGGQKVSNNPTDKQRREKQGKSQWLWWSKQRQGGWKWQPLIRAQEIGVLLLQLGIVMSVMRLLRPGIPLPGSEPRQPTTFISVPYSEFLSKISSNQVQKVEVDGVHIMFKLKSEGNGCQESGESINTKLQESESLLRSMAPTARRIVYTTTRPTDIKTPYEKMLENQVEFGSPDKRSGGFFNSALVSFVISDINIFLIS